MKHRISVALVLSLMLSMLFMPLAVSADDDKSIVKEMVQAPGDYSVGGLTSYIYGIEELDRYYNPGYMMSRPYIYLPSSWAFGRLM